MYEQTPLWWATKFFPPTYTNIAAVYILLSCVPLLYVSTHWFTVHNNDHCTLVYCCYAFYISFVCSGLEGFHLDLSLYLGMKLFLFPSHSVSLSLYMRSCIKRINYTTPVIFSTGNISSSMKHDICQFLFVFQCHIP